MVRRLLKRLVPAVIAIAAKRYRWVSSGISGEGVGDEDGLGEGVDEGWGDGDCWGVVEGEGDGEAEGEGLGLGEGDGRGKPTATVSFE